MSENDCIFCKIARGEMDAEVLHEDEDVVAFEDIDGKAPVHVLVIPKKHVPSVRQIGEEDGALLARIFSVLNRLAEEHGLAEIAGRRPVS